MINVYQKYALSAVFWNIEVRQRSLRVQWDRSDPLWQKMQTTLGTLLIVLKQKNCENFDNSKDSCEGSGKYTSESSQGSRPYSGTFVVKWCCPTHTNYTSTYIQVYINTGTQDIPIINSFNLKKGLGISFNQMLKNRWTWSELLWSNERSKRR